uniref:Nuclear RNA export factor Tap RNA-binding domain-containing protein n=1 Tax=Sus scrofa TaxID=9823 RepID=A0A8D1QBZ0_PIG
AVQKLVSLIRSHWFIFIPYGIKYDKTWLMDSIQSHCSVPFIPVDFHYVKSGARFFVQDASTASALMDVNYKICDEEDQKVCVEGITCTSSWDRRTGQGLLTLYKRYDVSQKALDLQRLRFDPGLVGHDIDIILNRRNCMSATLQVIKKNFPELLSLNLSSNKLYRLDGLSDIIQMVPMVKILNLSKNELKSAWELSKMKGLKLEELWLQGNPLCGTFPNQSTYIRSSPLLTSSSSLQDGRVLPSPRIVNIDTPYVLKPCKVRKRIKQHLGYLQGRFYQLCHLKCLWIPGKVQLLKHTKHDIVHSLCVLPKTQHDFSSFMVDMWLKTVSLGFFPRAGLGSHHRWGSCCWSLQWEAGLRAVIVPSPEPSSLPLPPLPGECCVVAGDTHLSLGSRWDCGGADLRFSPYCGNPSP